MQNDQATAHRMLTEVFNASRAHADALAEVERLARRDIDSLTAGERPFGIGSQLLLTVATAAERWTRTVDLAVDLGVDPALVTAASTYGATHLANTFEASRAMHELLSTLNA